MGEALEPSSGAQGALPSWTSCQPCGQEQLGLWRDMRPRLVPGGEFGNGSSTTALQAEMGAIVSGLVDRGSGDRATCRPCPSSAQCPVGAVVVPRPGWWHSAANSTQIHRCPYAPACGGRGAEEEELRAWQARQLRLQQQQPGIMQLDAIRPPAASYNSAPETAIPLLGDVRSAVLAQCQAAWYASGWRPGAAVAAAARQRGGLPGGNATASTESVPTQNSNAAISLCLLWFEEDLMPGLDPAAFAPLSYTQLQCAPSYTGNLCAACQPGFQAGARFQCEACPAVPQTAIVALLAFCAGVVVVLVSALANLYEDYTEEEASSAGGPAEILKVPHACHVCETSCRYWAMLTATPACDLAFILTRTRSIVFDYGVPAWCHVMTTLATAWRCILTRTRYTVIVLCQDHCGDSRGS